MPDRLGAVTTPTYTLPLRPRRRRTRHYPTLFGTFTLLLLGMAGLAAFRHATPLAIAWAGMAWTMTVIAIVQTHRSLSQMELMSLHCHEAVANQPAKAWITVRAMGFERTGRLAVGDGFALMQPGRTPQHVALRLPPAPRGFQTWPSMRLSSEHPFGLARPSFRFTASGGYWVYPASEPAAPPWPASALPGRGAVTAEDRVYEGVRPWQPWDGPRLVAWKASAHHDRLLSRDRLVQDDSGGRVHLSWSLVDGLPYEQAISRLAAWVDRAAQQRLLFRLDLPGSKLDWGMGSYHRNRALQRLAALPADRPPAANPPSTNLPASSDNLPSNTPAGLQAPQRHRVASLSVPLAPSAQPDPDVTRFGSSARDAGP